jgi:hypothetical protein
VSKVAREWNEQRRLIIRDALHKILLPVMESEARSELSQRARRFVVGECEKSLWRLAARAPYARKKADPDVSLSLRGFGWLSNEGFEGLKVAARMSERGWRHRRPVLHFAGISGYFAYLVLRQYSTLGDGGKGAFSGKKVDPNVNSWIWDFRIWVFEHLESADFGS